VLVWRKGWRALSLVPLGVFAVLTFILVKTRFEYSAMLHQTLMFLYAETMILMGIIGPTKRLDSKS
jgi:Na+/H+-dicarboxylate symporter